MDPSLGRRLASVLAAMATGGIVWSASCTVSTGGGGGGGGGSAGGELAAGTVGFPKTGDALVIIDEAGVGTATFFGTRDGPAGDSTITDMTIDSGNGLFGAAFDETGRTTRVILPSGAEIGLSHHADGTFDYSLTTDGLELFYGTNVELIDLEEFEATAKTVLRLAGIFYPAVLDCAQRYTGTVAQAAYNLESRTRPEADPLTSLLIADERFQEVLHTYCVTLLVVLPRLRDAEREMCDSSGPVAGCTGPEDVASFDSPEEAEACATRLCETASEALGNTKSYIVSMLGVAIDIARTILVERFPETEPPLPADDPDLVTLSGLVLNQETDKEVAGAIVQVLDSGLSATTDASGRYTISGVLSGTTHTIVVLVDGSEVFRASDVDFPLNEPKTFDIGLEGLEEPMPEESASFTIIRHQNPTGSTVDGGAGARIKVYGEASFPTITWSLANVVEIIVYERSSSERLYGITTRIEGVVPEDLVVIEPGITYGDYAIAGAKVKDGYPASSPPLEKGVEYTVQIESQRNPNKIPWIVFRID